MFSGEQIVTLLTGLGVTHVVTVPDSTVGQWYAAIEREPRLRLVRVCREGEAWAVAGGLFLGGGTPLVMIRSGSPAACASIVVTTREKWMALPHISFTTPHYPAE
jgi:sulfopyruvate decarboxylase TPP-binding subunit